MARPVSFASPARGRSRAPSLLGLPQFAILVSGVLLVPLCLVALLYPALDERWARLEVRALRAAHGFDVGDVATADGYPDWGITSVAPGGLAERAGLLAGDVFPDYHGNGSGTLLWALGQAREGRRACLDVSTMPARRAGLTRDRAVCFGEAPAAARVDARCDLGRLGSICRAPAGGAGLEVREAIARNGRRALVLRSHDGPDVLVRAFDVSTSVHALWSPDGRAVAIAERAGGEGWTLAVHWGPLLTRQADLTLLTGATGISVGPSRGVVAEHWEDASTLRLATGPMLRLTSEPAQRFRYRIDGALTPLP